MAATPERILQALTDAQHPLDDDQLAAILGVRRQAINQECRKLGNRGLLKRQVSVGNKIQNVLIGAAPPPRPDPPVFADSVGLLKEDEVKAAVRDSLVAEGYEVTVAWGHERGIDIEARSVAKRILIEAKGEEALQPQQVNYFLGALGELVQRLDDPEASSSAGLWPNHMEASLVCNAMSMALAARRRAPGLLFHSDRRSIERRQYTSADFRDLLSEHHVVQSLSRRAQWLGQRSRGKLVRDLQTRGPLSLRRTSTISETAHRGCPRWRP
jgi:hypothetical protein